MLTTLIHTNIKCQKKVFHFINNKNTVIDKCYIMVCLYTYNGIVNWNTKFFIKDHKPKYNDLKKNASLWFSQ